MPEDQHNSRGTRRRLKYALIVAFVLGLFISAAWYLSSARFNTWMRAKAIANLEQMTGGRVELKSFTWSLARLQFEARDLTIHGREAAGELPYAHADRLLVRISILSLLGRRIGLRSVELERPVIHLIVYPDGSTNQPTPKRKLDSNGAVQELFDLAVRRAVVRGGLLHLNDHRIPLDLTAENVALTMNYVSRAERYDGTVRVSRLNATYGDFRPVNAGGEVRFSLFAHSAELHSLHIASGTSEIRASGELVDFANPRLSLNYTAKLDLTQFASTMHLPQLRRGTLTIDGRGDWAKSGYTSSGKLTVQGADWVQGNVRVPAITGDASFDLDQRRLSVSQIAADVFGGKITGELAVTDWIRSAAPVASRAGQKSSGIQSGSIQLRLSGLALGQLLQAGLGRSSSLARVNLAGIVGGTVQADWKGSPDLTIAQITLDAVAPASPEPRQLPINGTLRASYDAGRQTLDLAALNLTTPASQASASGVLGRRSEGLRLSLATTNINELQPVMIALGAPAELPVIIRGPASFNGTLTGSIDLPAITGHLELSDFDTTVPPPTLASRLNVRGIAAEPGTPHTFHWDHFTGNVEYGPANAAIRGSLQGGNTQIALNASGSLRKGKFTDSSPLRLQASGRADLREVFAAAGFACAAGGIARFELHVSGTKTVPHGGGSFTTTNATICDQRFQRIASNITLANREAQFRNINVVQNGATLTGDAAYSLISSAFNFNLRGTNFQLARLQRLQSPRLSVAGLLDFTATGSGTREAPSIDAQLRGHNLVINGERVADVNAKAVTVGDTLRLTARANVQGGRLTVEGTTRLRDDYPADLRAQFSGLDIDPLLRIVLKGQLTGHSRAAGNIVLRGPLKTPRALNVAAELDRLLLEAGHVELRNDGPVRFTMADAVARLDSFRLVGADTSVKAGGTMQLTGRQRLDISADGQLNLKLLQTVNPGLVSYGLVTFRARLFGSSANPLVEGEMDVKDAGLAHLDLPNGVSELNGHLVFSRDRLQIAQLTGKSGGGTIEFAGHVGLSPASGFNVTALGRDVRIRYPPGVSSQANLNLRLSGTSQNAFLSGEVTITRFGLNPQFDFSTYLARAKQPSAVPNPQSPLAKLDLDVHIASTPELQVQTSLAKISGDADLRLRGTAEHPVILGKVNIIEGEMSFNGTRYRLERGSIAFANPVRIEPVLDIEATTTVRDYDITLGFHGPLGKLAATYRSDPPLATADIVNLLAFGRTREESALQTAQVQNVPETATYAILGEALNAAVSSRMQKLFGVSRIKIDPEAGGVANNAAGATVTVEQQVANNLTVTYITNLSRANYQTIQAEYNVNRNVSIVAVRDWNGVVSFDIHIRQRKK
ncbi:MAG: translocation/assembly module TamB domain-containing protein [Terriglobales bacterium]